MQSKGFIKLIAVLLALACVYQLSFTFKTRGVEKQAAAYAAQFPLDQQGEAEQHYLDSVQNLPVYNLGFRKFTYKECKEKELNLGLDLKGGMNVMLEVQVEDVVKALAGDSQNDPAFIEAIGVANEAMKQGSSTDYISDFVKAYSRLSNGRPIAELFVSPDRKDITLESSDADVEKILGVPRFTNDIYDIQGMVGIVTGLAWTEVGGDILYIESILTPGKGALTMTGNLGDVMKESATIALQWVKAHADELGIAREKFEKNDIHIHVPEGAIPKDGPSAGITMMTSLVSTLSGRRVKDYIAMTGETTLRGRVLPVGGIKEKILAAKRAGIREIVLSEENRKDISEIKPEYLEGLTFHYVKTNDDVLKLVMAE